ncbi:Uncharacterised protein [[Clostridium] sordellii]|nr:Uncharacterised protein [[Clostridium] sordellii] [Paeniclostridium sordellii]
MISHFILYLLFIYIFFKCSIITYSGKSLIVSPSFANKYLIILLPLILVAKFISFFNAIKLFSPIKPCAIVFKVHSISSDILLILNTFSKASFPINSSIKYSLSSLSLTNLPSNNYINYFPL